MAHVVRLGSGAGDVITRDVIARAIAVLRGEGVVAIPTDTIYGLAGLVSSDAAITRMYAIKARDANKPLAVCVPHISAIDHVAVTSFIPPGVLSALLPGPVTVVLPRGPNLNALLNPGHPTVGVRVVDHPLTRALVEGAGPIALTSANVSGQV